MSIKYEERNGRLYAYESTSKRVPWKKDPVRRKVHLGTVDPDTGGIVPKKGRGREVGDLDGCVHAKNYGDALLAMAAMHKSGMMEDLEDVFGVRGRELAAFAAALAIRQSFPEGMEETFSETCICELLGLDPSDMTVRHIMVVIGSLDPDSMRGYFQARTRRCTAPIYVVGSSMELPHEGSSSSRLIDKTAPAEVILTVVDGVGTPLGYMPVEHPDLNLPYVGSLMNELSNTKLDCVFVPDPSISQVIDVPALIMKKIEFIVPYTCDSNRFEEAEPYFHDLKADANMRIIGKSKVFMMERRVWVSYSKDGWSLSFARLSTGGFPICAYMVYDPDAGAMEAYMLRNSLDSLQRQFDGKDASDRSTLEMMAGPLYEMLNVTVGKDGMMNVRIRRSKVSHIIERNSSMLILSSVQSWDEMSRVYAARSGVYAVRSIRDWSDSWLLRYAGRAKGLDLFLFLKLLSLQIHSAIYDVSMVHGIRLLPEDALRLAATYKLIWVDGQTVRSDRDRRISRLLNSMEVEETEDPLHPKYAKPQ